MVSTGVVVGSLFVLGLFVLGVVQSMHGELPKSSLAGAVPVGKTQDEINACMKDCMRGCVTIEGSEAACLDACDQECGVQNP